MAAQEEIVKGNAFELLIQGDLGLDILNDLPRRDLLSVCLTSKTLRSVAVQALYYSCEWTEWNHNRTPSIVPFLRTLLISPDLRKHVKRLTFAGQGYGGLFTDLSLPALEVDSITLELGNAVIEHTRVPFSRAWKEAFAQGKADAILALLLALVSEVTHLRVYDAYTKHNKLLGEMFQAALISDNQHNLPAFQHLRDLSHELQWVRGHCHGQRTFGVLLLFYLPNLTRLIVDLGNPPVLVWPGQPPLARQLRSLSVVHIREPQLAKVLSCTPNLEELICNLVYSPDYHNISNSEVFDLDLLSEAINLLSASLVRLEIRAFPCPAAGAPDHPEVSGTGHFSNLQDFVKLKYLRIPALFLTDFILDARYNLNVVPAGIQKLELGDDLYGYHLNLGPEIWYRMPILLEDVQAWATLIHGNVAERRPHVSIVQMDEDDDSVELCMQDGRLCLDESS